MRFLSLGRLVSALSLTALMAAALGTSDASSWVTTKSRAFPVRASLVTGHLSSATPMHVIVSLKLQHEAELKTFLDNQHRAGSPFYGVTLTPAQFAAAYSPTTAQTDPVVTYLAAKGFKNISVSSNRLLINADGTAGIVESAFNTRLGTFAYLGKNYFAPTSDLMVPDTLGGIVLGVHGVDNVMQMIPATKARLQADEVPGKVKPSAAGTPALISAYTAAAFQKAYDVGNTPKGSGTVIAISSAGSDLQQVITDLRQYERDANLPSVPVDIVQSSAIPATQDHLGDGEWDLDSQTSTGMAGHVKQLVFYNGTDLGNSLLNGFNDFAIQKRAIAGNMSYGGCEILQHANDPTGDPAGLQLFADFVSAADQHFKQAVAQGQTWFASSGDAGAACSLLVNIVTPDFGVPSQVEYPASSPYVVAVGGTSLITDSDFNYITETAWDAGGGGFSLTEKAPSWQNAVVPTAGVPPGGGRGVPDISMVAGGPDVGTPVGFVGFGGADIVSKGSHGAAIGTSLSSPLAVGVWARLQSTRCNSMTFAAPYFYKLDPSPGVGSTATGFNDILIGTNGQYVAAPGWDFTTGYGTFDIAKVNAALSAIAPIPAGCTTTVAAPVAALSASTTLGPSPLPVTFDASQSADPSKLTLSDYSIDFGDGTTQNQSTPVFAPHVYNAPGTYTAVLRVTNVSGGISNTVSKTVTAFGTPLACAAGGQLMLTSPPGVALAEQGQDLGNGTDDLRATSFGEPTVLNNKVVSNKLIITTKVDNLKTVQPGFRWVTYFDVVGRNNPNTEYYYVAMTSSNGPTPVFEYGIHSYLPGPQPLTLFTPMGKLDAASNYAVDGTITLVLDKAAFNLKKGDVLSNIYTSIRLSTPTDSTGTVPGGAGLTQDSAGSAVPYIVVGNETCAPNVAPDAALSATPASPLIGQAVSLDASASHDADPQDTVKYYNFDFGDGGGSGWQTNAVLSHVYTAAGSFSPTVQVADSRGKLGSSPATVTVAVAAAPPPPTSSGLIAQLAADAVTGRVPLAVRFNASGSKNQDGSAIRSPKFTFYFGDGTPPSAPQASPVFDHSYTAAGTFKPYVIVTDADNQSAVSPQLSITSTVLVTVTGAAPETVAQLTLDNAIGPAPLTVTFDGSRSFPADGATITSYAFDFGDNTPPVVGKSSTAKHVYTVPGSYQPRLTVTDSRMATSVAKAAVLIQDNGSAAGTGSVVQKSGGGALGLMTLLPLLGFGIGRRRQK